MAVPKFHLLILEDRCAVCGLIESSEALDGENGIWHVPQCSALGSTLYEATILSLGDISQDFQS